MWQKKRKARQVQRPEFDSLISERTRLEGRLLFSGGVHLDGLIVGDVIFENSGVDVAATSSKPVFRVSRQGEVQGDIYAPHVIINGRVSGNVHASGLIELAEHARVTGDVHYGLLDMAPGAEVNGKLIKQTDPT